MSFNLRDALSAIFTKTPYKVGPAYSQFAINQYLSKYKQYISLVAMISTLKLPDEAHFKYLQSNTGYGWPPKREIKADEVDPRIEYIMRYYKCSRRDAKDYLLFMDEEEIQSLVDFYEFKGDINGKGSTHR